MRKELAMTTTRTKLRPQLEALEDRLTPSTLYALNATGTALLRFDSGAPDVITNAVKVSGLQGGETLRGIDFRPLTGHFYALGVTDSLKGNDVGRVYEVNGLTG